MMDPDALQSVGVESERHGEEPTWSVIDENAAREDVATKENDQLTIRDLLPAEVNTDEGRELDLQPFSWKAQLGRVKYCRIFPPAVPASTTPMGGEAELGKNSGICAASCSPCVNQGPSSQRLWDRSFLRGEKLAEGGGNRDFHLKNGAGPSKEVRVDPISWCEEESVMNGHGAVPDSALVCARSPHRGSPA